MILRSIVVAIQGLIMNPLSIGGTLGPTVPVFQDGFLAHLIGIAKDPIAP